MRGNFDPCLRFVLKEEGGNDDDPDDPGGRTSRGIEQREYTAFCKLHSLSHYPADVFEAPQAVIEQIYQQQYWLPYCEMLPPGMDLVFFDTHVLEGLVPAVRFLQHAVHVEADGHLGLVTAAAVRGINDFVGVVTDVTAQRKNAFRGMRKYWKYGKGWNARADACLTLAVSMSHGIQPKAGVVA